MDAPAQPQAPTVLAVDDNPANLRLLVDMLQGAGLRVLAARSGALALQAVARRGNLDLVLLDVDMPEMDGYEVCRRLRQEPRHHTLPVIFVSAYTDTETKLRAFAAGGVDYVTKPYAADEVLARVRTHLSLRAARYELEAKVVELNREVERRTRAEQALTAAQAVLEARVAGRTAALRRSNEELREYARVVAHQLHEPLRSITGFIQLLARRYRGRLDEDADQFIGFAVDGVARMERLLDGLLVYAEVGSGGEPLAEVDCERLLGEVVEAAAEAIRARRAVVTHERLPTVTARRGELAMVFGHLLDNALRFAGERAPRVHWQAARESGEWHFRVCDQGIGIAPRHQQRIFELFRTLQGPRADGGTGIGLALCRKVIEQHGGRIWVESEEGAGATFHFTLPLAPPDGGRHDPPD